MTSAQDWFKQGETHAGKGDFAKALECYNESLKLDPNNSNAHREKASQLHYLGRNPEAIQSADKAIALNPNDNWAYNWKGMALYWSQKYAEAIKAYDQSIQICEKKNDKSNLAVALNYKSSAQNELGDFDGCLETSAKSLALGKTMQAYCDRARYFKMKKDFEGALKTYDEAIATFPEDFAAYFNKGEILQDLKRYEEALDCFLKGCALIKAGKKSAVAFPNQIQYYSDTFEQKVKDLMELLQISKLADEHFKKIDQKDQKAAPIVKKFIKIQQNQTAVLENFTKQPDQSEDIKKLKEGFAALLKEVGEIKHTLDEAGVSTKAYVVKSFKELNNENPKLFEYCKAFYWTLFNYFGAYRHLSTGLMKGNVDAASDKKEGFIMSGLKKLMSFGAEVASGLPFIGGLIGVIDKIIDGVYSELKKKRFEDRVNAINKIIMFNQDPTAILEEDISLTIAKAAIEITKTKKDAILNPTPHSNAGALSKESKWFREQIRALKDMAFGESIDLYDSPSSVLALEDVTLLLAYLYRSHEMIIKKTDIPLSDQLKNIVTSGKSDSMIESIQVESSSLPPPPSHIVTRTDSPAPPPQSGIQNSAYPPPPQQAEMQNNGSPPQAGKRDSEDSVNPIIVKRGTACCTLF